MEKTAVKGMHVTAGQMLYKIADLSTVWIEADVYERELPIARVGGRAIVTLDAYPGERFAARVIYIYPYVDEQTQTNKVRYELANRGGRLKPGMFVTVEIAAPAQSATVVPLNALLDSGKEQIVFVGLGDGYFEPRKVKAGRRLGEEVEILEGIREGELVATGAAFFLDSESQLRAGVQGYEPSAISKGSPTSPAAQLDISFRTTPDPPKTGDNQIEVAVKDASGRPVDGAEVSVQFFMPAMPTMNMPAMKSEARLAPAGGGVYRGPGQVMMAGQWQATVTVMRGGQRLGSRQLPMVAR
jgi:nitrogen fixation protein FixH